MRLSLIQDISFNFQSYILFDVIKEAVDHVLFFRIYNALNLIQPI